MRKVKLEDKLFLVKTKKDNMSHISIDRSKCKDCDEKICLTVCPARTYEEVNNDVEAVYENCLECGSCRVVCTKNAITWDNPRGGFGITYKNG